MKKKDNSNRQGLIIFAVCLLLAPILFWFSFRGINDPPEKQLEKMTQEERAFVESTLSKIDKNTNKARAIKLLGNPDRDTLGSKLEWKLVFDGKRSGLKIYFIDGQASEVRFDGGVGRYYYVKDIE